MLSPRVFALLLLLPLSGCSWGSKVEPDLPPDIAGVYVFSDLASFDQGSGAGSPQVYAGFTVEPQEFFPSYWIEATQSASIPHATQWRWDFGGAAGSEPFLLESPVPIAFHTPGTFNASVTATNQNGSDTFPFTFTVLPLGKPRLVLFRIREDSSNQAIESELISGRTYLLEGLFAPGPMASPGPAPDVVWNLGGGLTAEGGTSEPFVYAEAAEPGNYSGSVTATNSAGSTVHTFDYTVVQE